MRDYVGRVIRCLRELQGISMDRGLAAKTGISRFAVYSIEKGIWVPQINALRKVANALHYAPTIILDIAQQASQEKWDDKQLLKKCQEYDKRRVAGDGSLLIDDDNVEDRTKALHIPRHVKRKSEEECLVKKLYVDNDQSVRQKLILNSLYVVDDVMEKVFTLDKEDEKYHDLYVEGITCLERAIDSYTINVKDEFHHFVYRTLLNYFSQLKKHKNVKQ